MDLEKFKDVVAVTIKRDALDDLLGKKTNNPIAEAGLPALLKQALEAGVPVIVSDDFGSNRLVVNDGGEFVFQAGVPTSTGKVKVYFGRAFDASHGDFVRTKRAGTEEALNNLGIWVIQDSMIEVDKSQLDSEGL